MKAALLAPLFLSLAGCARHEALPVYGRVPAFVLTSQTGATFDSKTLEGKIWVADFFFTTCMGPCPRMSAQMHSVQKRIADLPDVRLVSFSVDPQHDTPTVLAAYAQRFRADPSRWYMLTGSPATLNTLDRDAFKMGNVDGTFTHSTLFALVDRSGLIRGYFHTEEGATLDPLIAAIHGLEVGQVSTPAAGLQTRSSLPLVNAILNGTAAVLLVWGYTLIRRGRKRTHRNVMLAAFTVSTIFLICYLIYHAQAGVVRFAGTGPIRTLYFAILITHTLLAADVPPLAIVTLSRGLRSRFDRHRAIARWTLPIWLYVSVTGVVVYWMLYRM